MGETVNIMKVIVFGATTSARTVYEEIEEKYEIVALTDNDPEKWLEDFASIIYSKNILGAVAEAGVFQGEFASVINSIFLDRK